jgi:hypothetical protein
MMLPANGIWPCRKMLISILRRFFQHSFQQAGLTFLRDKEKPPVSNSGGFHNDKFS